MQNSFQLHLHLLLILNESAAKEKSTLAEKTAFYHETSLYLYNT